MTDTCMHELEHGRLYRFKDWPIDAVPKEPGVYTVWNEVSAFLYVGIAKKGHLEGKNGLRGRLGSHANGRRGGDQFNVYVADRLVLQLLKAEQIARISAGKLLFDNMLKDYTRDNLSFRFSPCPKSDAENVESQLAAGRWPNGKKPLLNPS